MPDFPFLLTYADVPFISDVARSFTMKQPVPEQEDAVTTPPKKHQSNADLIDEVNRLISLKLLNDFDSPSDFMGRSLSAVAQLGNAQTWPNASIPVGTFYHPTNAKRFGVFRGLATSSMVKAMLAVTQGVSPATFTMKQPPLIGTFQNSDSYTISTDLYMLPPRPLAEHGAGFNGLFLVTLVDERYYWSNPASLRVTHNSTWESLLTAIAAVLNITLSIPAIPAAYGRPEPDSQLWCTGQNAAVLFDAIAFNIGCVVVRNLDGSYSLLNGAASRTIVDTNRGNAHSVVRMAGGDIFYSGTKLPTGNLQPSRNSVVPSAIVTHFPKYIQGDDPVPHFSNLRNTPQRPSSWFEDSFGDVYSLSVPISSGGVYASGLSGTSTYILTDTAKALFSGENQAISGNAPLNISGLTALAMQTASDFYAGQVAVALDEVYPGTFNWQPDGIHDLIWTWSERDRVASTRVMKTLWDADITEYQHGTPPLSGYTNTPRGIGGQTVAQTWRDSSSSVISGTILGSGLVASGGGIVGSGDTEIILSDVSYLPTQNRWRGRINSGLVGDETVLFEGTSGGIPSLSGGFRVGVVYRAIDGSLTTSHNSGDKLTYAGPDVSYGTNLVTTEKGQFIAPGAWTSGGITEARIIPQTQTVRLFSASGIYVNGALCYSGIVESPNTLRSGYPYDTQELVWATERNSGIIRSGARYDGQFLGWSKQAEQTAVVSGFVGPVSGTFPIYAIDNGRGGIFSGDINSGNLSVTDWTINMYAPASGGPAVNFYGFFNWNPTYVATFTGTVYALLGTDIKLVFTESNDISITNFTGGTAGRVLVVWNRGAGKVVLIHGAGIITPLSADYTLWTNDGVILEYDADSSSWRFDVPTFAGSSGQPTTPGVYGLRHLRFLSGLDFTPAGQGKADVSLAPPYGASGNCGGISWSGYIVTDVTCTSGTLSVTKSIFSFECGLLKQVV